jgi:nicotinate phosphoribosyltransferase
VRRRDADGTAVEEVIGIGHRPAGHRRHAGGDDRVLLRQLVSRGEAVDAGTLADARPGTRRRSPSCPPRPRQLSRGEPVLTTRYEPAALV